MKTYNFIGKIDKIRDYSSKMHKFKVHHFSSLPSTQEKAKEFAKKGIFNVVIVSDVQTIGRGRLNRRWHSDKGGLWISILLKPKSISESQYLTFAAAIAATRSIKKITGVKAKIKWPNDVHYKKKKLCGILTEGIFGHENYVIVGIGINVNQDKFHSEIKNTATSLKLINKRKFKIEKLMESVLDDFFDLYGKYSEGKLNYIKRIWKNNCDTFNKKVIVSSKTKKISGTALDVDANCNLLLKTKNGKILKIVEGDLIIRY